MYIWDILISKKHLRTTFEPAFSQSLRKLRKHEGEYDKIYNENF